MDDDVAEEETKKGKINWQRDDVDGWMFFFPFGGSSLGNKPCVPVSRGLEIKSVKICQSLATVISLNYNGLFVELKYNLIQLCVCHLWKCISLLKFAVELDY